MLEPTPFTVNVPDEVLDDLRARLRNTRWAEAETVDDWSQGIPLSYTKELCDYWAEEYDWRAREAHHNQFDQFTAAVGDLNIHFIHQRSPHEDAKPLLITHGWPGSVVEFHKVIGPLTNPTEHGGDAADAFHVVAPSIPGFGFSDKPTTPGTGIERVAALWAELMGGLGYESFVAQGGDWGSIITTALGCNHSDVVDGIHLNMPIAGPDPETMSDLTESEQVALAALEHYDKWDSGYSKQQSTRPQSLGYGLVDSPAGQAAWIAEKMWAWTDNEGHPEDALTRDEILDNIMYYWVPGTGASSARLYWESFSSVDLSEVTVPTGCSIFPKEILRTSQRWAAKRFTNITYWNELDHGGHFAAFEEPEVFVNELRTFFRTLR